MMDSATVGIPKGDPNYYKINTEWNHAPDLDGGVPPLRALVASARRARANVATAASTWRRRTPSGCSTHSKMGDVVKFTGSTRPFQPTEGIGVWSYGFAGWKAQSALASRRPPAPRTSALVTWTGRHHPRRAPPACLLLGERLVY